jgi:DNA-binding CsgD family transcriptional regulator
MLPDDRNRSQRNLSGKEQNVLQRIADGQSTKQIAITLGVSGGSPRWKREESALR